MNSRYARQILFGAIGTTGQRQLGEASVTVVGCGALGSVSSEILARAGIGRLTIIDRDFVEFSNLQRQSLFTEKDALQSIPKAVAAEKALKSINSEIVVQGIVSDLTYRNISKLCSNSDLIVDGSDNFEVRFLINDYCVKGGIPWIYAAALGSYGISFAIVPGETACLRCFFAAPPGPGTVETCETAGILAPVIHMVSAFQSSQVLKILLEKRTSAKILQVDVWEDTLRTVSTKGPVSACECCQRREFPFLDGEEGSLMTQLCGRDAVQITPRHGSSVDLVSIARRLSDSLEIRSNDYLLRASTGKHEIVVFSDGRTIIRGTGDYTEARAVYSKYIGN